MAMFEVSDDANLRHRVGLDFDLGEWISSGRPTPDLESHLPL
jgi:hypothetical protein